MLDKLPAWARHLLIITAVAALTVISQGIANGGVQSIDWQDVLNAAVAALVTAALLLLTPLTNQYGVGAPPAEVQVQGNEPPMVPQQPPGE